MVTVRNGDERILKILGTKPVDEKATYRISQYAFVYRENDRCFVRHMLTGRIAELTGEENALLESAKENGISGDALSASNGDALVASHILVPQTSNDLQTYQTVMLVLQNAARAIKGIKNYTILPTTACNARCVYCYEEGFASQTMSAETADRTVDFISRTRRDGPIKLIWFGGEPLAAHTAITRICEGLKDRSISYSSEMITNATLMTAERIEEAKTLWNLKKAQVSVDGLPADYEKRKHYVDAKAHNYDALIQALHRMLDAGIDVTLRCNYDRENYPGLRQFAESIRAEFGDTDLLHLYFAMLFQERDTDDCICLHRSVNELREELNATGLTHRPKAKKPFHIKTNHCMADSFGDSVVIDPNGQLFRCEHLPGQKPFGTVLDDPYRYSMPEGWSEPDERCRNCCFLPDCTPFYRNGCPDYTEYCREFKRSDTEYEIRQAVKDFKAHNE